MPKTILAFDAGATKTAWALISEDGTKTDQGVFPTPREREGFLAAVRDVLESFPDHINAVGIGVAGMVSPDHRNTFVCPNIPGLSYLELATFVESTSGKPCAVENDGRCALIGEVWQGVAQETSGAVLITLGTGVGGAVMQRRKILEHPTDLSQEISHLMVDPHDLFPASSGHGTVEAMIGGRNLEERYGVTLEEMARLVRKEDPEAIDFWNLVSEAFAKCILAIHATYDCKMIIVGGRGCADLAYYLGDMKTPCPVVAAGLGAEAGLYGAAKMGMAAADEAAKDWDEE
jgi:glucokinase